MFLQPMRLVLECGKKMKAKKEKSGAARAARKKKNANELGEPRWSVVSFETCVAKNLTYTEAEQKMRQLEEANVSGLCIVTDEVAERVGGCK